MNIRKMLCCLTALLFCAFSLPALGEVSPVTAVELYTLADQLISQALSSDLLNDPSSEDARSEDGTAFQYEFGVVYADAEELTADTPVNAILIADDEVAALRGISINTTVAELMRLIPCENPDMYGDDAEALLYLEGDPENGYSYGRVQRNGQRISAIEYGVADPENELRVALTCQINGDGVGLIRLDGLNEAFPQDASDALFEELSALKQRMWYSRVPVSYNGAELEMFCEADLDFLSLSYLTAQPEQFGDNVEDMLIDNEDETFLRRIDGDGFEAVFTCDSEGRNALLVSYTLLSDDLEGPRSVRLGDYFQEDFNRFRNGEGKFDEAAMSEVLYGTVGTAPYGLAEYGTGDEMTLRYVTKTSSGREVELYLHYTNTVLDIIILHTL